MSYPKNQQRAIIATPATANAELHNSIVASMVTHFTPLLGVDLMVANRKGCYATVINSTINGISLENTLGTVKAKAATEEVLTAISANISTITIK